MELYTIGQNYFPQAKISLKTYKNLSYIPECAGDTVYQIVIIESGTGIIKINDKRAIIHAPAAYFLNETEAATMEETTGIKLHLVYFQPSIIDINFDFKLVIEYPRDDVTDPKVQDLFLLNEFLFRNQIFKDHSQLTHTMLQKLLYFIDGIQDEFENQRTFFWMCRGRSYFLEMLCYLSKLQTADTPDLELALRSDSSILEEALLYIHTNYAEKITLNHLVECFHVNRTTLNELFQKEMGESIVSYIIKFRIEISSLMLRDTGIPVQEIAYRIGFENSGHFGRTFKRLKGCSPSKYREEYSWLLRLY
jgi:AraC-like DNA-binding protein